MQIHLSNPIHAWEVTRKQEAGADLRTIQARIEALKNGTTEPEYGWVERIKGKAAWNFLPNLRRYLDECIATLDTFKAIEFPSSLDSRIIKELGADVQTITNRIEELERTQ